MYVESVEGEPLGPHVSGRSPMRSRANYYYYYYYNTHFTTCAATSPRRVPPQGHTQWVHLHKGYNMHRSHVVMA